ncbi:hypothetical protein UFOVP833_9 [uncultured Caudovirales phage]|uniref:Uncharacterized protein n=1 Tax=uncultured Caudovirales phage TaxID=2100421 RepID=A0A6J5P6X9_9CAUD|nr:hypothetical protein UFOVP833_9 [uncultured Caudovirales phage]CAB4218157.1 hypothetical protein UFOVP1603_16 [uncultured Caudovirales phage]
MICFRGSYGNGADVDIVEWCGLKLSSEQRHALWDNINVTDLIDLTQSGSIDIEREIDDAPPGLNDTYYAVSTNKSIREFKNELRAAIVAVITKAIQL